MTPSSNILLKLSEELRLAFSLLTRFPVPQRVIKTKATLTSAFWAYPIAAFAVGAFGAQIFWIAHKLGMGDMISIALAMTTMVLATGGFHEDGLADFWDGVGGGQTRERKLEIMRDSRLGTYGALALFLGLFLIFALYSEHMNRTDENHMVSLMIAVSVMGRVALSLPLMFLPMARTEGLAVVAGRPSVFTVLFGIIFCVLLSLFMLGSLLTFLLFAGGFAGAAFIAFIAYIYLGGYTGDVLGATAFTAQITALIAVLLGTPLK